MEKEDLEKMVLMLSQQVSTLVGALSANTSQQIQNKFSLFDWINEWYNTYKKPTSKDKGYKMGLTIEKHIKANILNKPLNEVTSLDITKALNQIESSRMRQMTYCLYNQLFEKALQLELILKNPMKNVESIKHEYNTGRALTIAEQKHFLYISKNNKLRPLYMFYLLTGCRRTEALNLKWDDIKNGQITIHGTKTKNAERTLPLFPQLEKLLSTIPKKGELIFPYSAGMVRKNFERLRDKLDFKDFSIHDLRHTFATRCLESGVSMKTVQKWLGHSKYETTADIYSHVTTEFEQSEIAKFSDKIIALKSDRK